MLVDLTAAAAIRSPASRTQENESLAPLGVQGEMVLRAG
jgi:hypothetical protein